MRSIARLNTRPFAPLGSSSRLRPRASQAAHSQPPPRPPIGRPGPSSQHGSRQGFGTCTQRRASNMADARAWGAWQIQPSKFTQLVVDSMKKLYPEELADRSWDNVGLLVGNAQTRKKAAKVMVTNDLTYQVAIDAIEQDVSVIVSYHPFIFSGLKSITNRDPQQATLLRLAQADIAVYCPHTAVDAGPRGLNTWLADIIAGQHASSRSVAIPCATAPESHAPAGYGALGRFDDDVAVPLPEILKRLAVGLGGLQYVMVASPVGADVATTTVRSFGVCAGSGYDVLKGADVELLVTGETSHHSALRVIQQGRTLVQVFHSNSERAYLNLVLRPRLEEQLRAEAPAAEVVLSVYDRDPFRIVDVRELA
ncbi:UPF0135 protein [Tolypocladium capitatum]|uniref:UPF0135 protein n=1 Tax=Tolypocladium capitatum TaxID=45235 RepID=A0A2K3Q7G4_9HYPO|nr:UPF0135 protein [Tolypocladium capitatum]